MGTIVRILGFMALLLASALPAMAADYDLVILNGWVMDPETMLDARLNVGVKDSRFQKVWAGQPIRFPVEKKGRFVPTSVEEWIATHAIPVHDCPASPDSPYH